jgi:hypothetical protein
VRVSEQAAPRASPADGGYTRSEAASAVGPGWQPLVEALWDLVQGAAGRVVDVKEKWGVLQVRIEGAEAVAGEVERLVDAATRTCEGCGGAGTLRRRDWHRTLCDLCARRVYQDGHAVGQR